jgi:hypothetical protein
VEILESFDPLVQEPQELCPKIIQIELPYTIVRNLLNYLDLFGRLHGWSFVLSYRCHLSAVIFIQSTVVWAVHHNRTCRGRRVNGLEVLG